MESAIPSKGRKTEIGTGRNPRNFRGCVRASLARGQNIVGRVAPITHFRSLSVTPPRPVASCVKAAAHLQRLPQTIDNPVNGRLLARAKGFRAREGLMSRTCSRKLLAWHAAA